MIKCIHDKYDVLQIWQISQISYTLYNLRYVGNAFPLNGMCASSSCTTSCVCLKLKKTCRPNKRWCLFIHFIHFHPLSSTFIHLTLSRAGPSAIYKGRGGAHWALTWFGGVLGVVFSNFSDNLLSYDLHQTKGFTTFR